MTEGRGSHRYVVVGGGIAGLVLARDLASAGRAVTVLEASDRFGGQLARLSVAGIETDAAAESFATRGGTVAALAAELGLGDQVVTPLDAPAWLHRVDGSAVPLPATSVLGIPGVPMATDVIAAIGARAAWRAQLDTLLPSAIGSRSRTLGELVRRRMGRGVLDGLVAPVVRGVHSSSPDDLDLDRAVPGLRAALRREVTLAAAVRDLRERAPAGSQVAGIRGGVVRLVDELLADLQRAGAELRTGARVDEVTPDAAVVRAVDGATTGAETLRGHVVLAAAGSAGELVGTARETRRITLVTLAVESPELDAAPRGTGVLVADGAPGVAARALTHATAKWAWLAERAGGRHILRLSYDAAPDHPPSTAARDAAALLGVELHVVDAVTDTWTRTLPAAHAVDGMDAVGEAGSTTGLAAVVAGSRELADRILGVTDPSEPPA